MNKQKGVIPSTAQICAHQLNWSRCSFTDDFGRIREQLPLCATFDVVIASDCLFFREFHEDLVEALSVMMTPVSGIALLFQPARDGTMRAFLELCKDLFVVEVLEDYFEELSCARDMYRVESTTRTPPARVSPSNGYNDDIHFPLLCILRWK